MRCLACNEILNDTEATRKYASTGEYLDLCNTCYDTIKDQLETVERPELTLQGEEYDS